MQIATLQDRSRLRLSWAMVNATSERYGRLFLFGAYGRILGALHQALAGPINTAVNGGTDDSVWSRISTEVACR